MVSTRALAAATLLALAVACAAAPSPNARSNSAQRCLTALATPEGHSWLMRQARRCHIDSRVRRQRGEFARVLVADLAGVGEKPQPIWREDVPIGPVFVGGTHYRHTAPYPRGRRLSDEQRQRLPELLAAEGVDGLMALGDPLLSRALWDDTTTTGHLIRLHAKGRHPELPTFARRLSIGLHELAIAIAVGTPAEDFARLLDAADVDPASTWDDGTNLAKVAALHIRPALLELLTARGIDPTMASQWRHRSVLDEIAGQAKPAAGREAALAVVVSQLVAAGDRPNLPSTLATLANWLPDAPLPALHARSARLMPRLRDAADAIAELDAEWAEKVAAAKRLEARCEAQPADTKLALAAFKGTGLAAKLRYQDALRARGDAWRSALEDEAAATGDDVPASVAAGLEGVVHEMFWAVMEDRWDEAQATADQAGGHAHVALLYLALDEEAPLDLLLALARRAGWALPLETARLFMYDWDLHRFPYEGAILELALFPRWDIATVVKALEPEGLDLHYVDAQGRNAFNVITRHPIGEPSWRLAELLASRSVSAKPSAYGMDPLDNLLMYLSLRPTSVHQDDIRFARFLVDHGAPNEESHLFLASQIAVDEDAHRRLLRAVPELAGVPP